MKKQLNLTFEGRKERKMVAGVSKLSGFVAIFCHLSIEGKDGKVIVPTGCRTTVANWTNKEGGQIIGRTAADRELTAKLTKLQEDLTDVQADLWRQGEPATAQRIVDLHEAREESLTLRELFKQFLAEQESLIGIEIAKVTLFAQRSRYHNFIKFLAAHQLQDIRPQKFTHSMADKMRYWLMGPLKFGRNSAIKNLQSVSQVMRWAVRRELLDKNPMELYCYKLAPPKDIIFLTTEQVQALAILPLGSRQLERVRDGFILQCWTGLAYADLAALDVAKQAEVLPDGRRILRVRRKKSTITHYHECVIPLLPEAERILARYSDHVPVCVNQLYNKCLKQIGELAGLTREQMSSHVGRKTAGVLMLNVGIRMEVVSKFLGHASVKMTEKVYAKILDKTIMNEFDRVFPPAPTPPAAGIVAGPRLVSMWAEPITARKESASA